MAMAVRQRKAGEGRALAALESVLREAYEAARSGRQGQQEHEVELPERGNLLVKVYAEPLLWSNAVIFEVRNRGDDGKQPPLCYVWLEFEGGKPYKFDMDCEKLGDLASRCARGGGCALSWEEMENVLGLTVWAVNRLAELAGIPVKVERTSLVKAYNIKTGEMRAFPCLQVSVDGESYSVYKWARLYRNPDGSWGVEHHDPRLVLIGKRIKMMAVALAELKEMVEQYIRNREREGAERARASKHWGEFLGLEEVVLRRRDGTEEVLLVPWFYELDYLGEDFAVVECPPRYSKSNDDKLADAIRKEVEKVMEEVVRAVRRYMETGDPRLTTFAYIVVEALRKAGLAPA